METEHPTSNRQTSEQATTIASHTPHFTEGTTTSTRHHFNELDAGQYHMSPHEPEI